MSRSPTDPIDAVDVSPPTSISIGFPPPQSAEDTRLISSITDMINHAYEKAEGDLFADKREYRRTTPEQITALVRAGHLACAHRNTTDELVGCMVIREASAEESTSLNDEEKIPRAGRLSLLALNPSHQGLGIGRTMVLYAEEHCRTNLGLDTLRLELLIPTSSQPRHALKERMQAWYLRLGYEAVRVGRYGDEYPHLEKLLAVPAEYRIYEKSLKLLPGTKEE
jgi:ribosomal protein S18 acetylase RimI-like enzyme